MIVRRPLRVRWPLEFTTNKDSYCTNKFPRTYPFARQGDPASHVGVFFALTYVVTWTFWFAASALAGGMASAGHLRPGIPALLFYLGVFAPGFVALALTGRDEGGEGVRALLRGLFRWQVLGDRRRSGIDGAGRATSL